MIARITKGRLKDHTVYFEHTDLYGNCLANLGLSDHPKKFIIHKADLNIWKTLKRFGINEVTKRYEAEI